MVGRTGRVEFPTSGGQRTDRHGGGTALAFHQLPRGEIVIPPHTLPDPDMAERGRRNRSCDEAPSAGLPTMGNGRRVSDDPRGSLGADASHRRLPAAASSTTARTAPRGSSGSRFRSSRTESIGSWTSSPSIVAPVRSPRAPGSRIGCNARRAEYDSPGGSIRSVDLPTASAAPPFSVWTPAPGGPVARRHALSGMMDGVLYHASWPRPDERPTAAGVKNP